MALIIAEMSLKILSQHEVKNIWENSLQMPQKNQTQTKPVQGWRERSTLNRVLIMWKHSLVCEWTLKKWLQIYLKNNPSLGRGLRLTVVGFFFSGQFPHPSVDVVYADLDVTSTRLSCILNRAVSPSWWGGGGWGRTVLTLLDIDLRTRHPSPGASCLSCWTELMSLSWFTTRYFIRSWSNNWANGSWTERCRCFAR